MTDTFPFGSTREESRGRYPPEFKEQIVELVRAGRSARSAADGARHPKKAAARFTRESGSIPGGDRSTPARIVLHFVTGGRQVHA